MSSAFAEKMRLHPMVCLLPVVVAVIAAVQWRWGLFSPQVSWSEGAETFDAVVAGVPRQQGKTVVFEAVVVATTDAEAAGARPRKVQLRLLVDREGRARRLQVGQGIRATAVVRPMGEGEGRNFRSFRSFRNFRNFRIIRDIRDSREVSDRRRQDYYDYLRHQGFSGTSFVLPWQWHEERVSLRPLSVVQRLRLRLLACRQWLVGRMRAAGLTGDEGAVAIAMTLGDKTRLGRDVRQLYSQAGVSHVLALSGLHLSIFVMVFSLLLWHRHSLLTQLPLVAAVWLYVMLVGLPLSLVRSALMLTVCALFSVVGRDRQSLNVLAFVGVVMLLVSPSCLFDIGFQLSFASVASILLFCPLIEQVVDAEWQQSHPVLRWLWRAVCVTVAAQPFTVPLTLYHFGQLSLCFVPTNLLVVFFVPVILGSVCLLALLAPLPWLSHAVGGLTVFAVWGFHQGIAFFASLPYSSFTGLHVSAVQVLLLYVVALSLLALCRRLSARRIELAVLSLLLLALSFF